MPQKFNYDEHKKRMRELLTPRPVGGSFVERLRQAARQRLPKLPKLPKI